MQRSWNPKTSLPWQASLPSSLILFWLRLAAASAVGVVSDAAALSAFVARADPGNRLPIFSPANGSDHHCRWPGVTCSAEGRVVRLVVEAAALNGAFAGGTLDRLDQLRVLSLKANSLAGPIPDLSLLINLKALFLGHNRFAGGFPASVVSLHRLRTLDLSYNHLSGPVPPALTLLDRLLALRLESNRFTGSIPSLNQSSLKSFNVSHNNFSGAIPATTTLSSFGASVFSANTGLCGVLIGKRCGSQLLLFPDHNDSRAAPAPAKLSKGQREEILLPDAASPAQRMHKRAVIAAGLLVGLFIVIGVLAFSLVMKKKKQKQRAMQQREILSPVKQSNNGHADASQSNLENYTMEIESDNNQLVAAAAMAMSEEKVKKLAKSGCLVFCAGEAEVYSLEQLMKASAEMLGKGSMGTTYKAMLDEKLIVTVKRLDAAKLATTLKEPFERHMDMVGRFRHPNLVPLRAYFQGREERLLVYDYQPNGSLHSLVHGSRSTRPKHLHWTSCLKIAEDIAQGLAYIHQASHLVHGNIKSSNVLLGSDFEACLTDNCLSISTDPSKNGEDSGYRAPESQITNAQLTPRSDIYAFGVLLLELLTGRPPLQQLILSSTDLRDWVRSVREDGADDERLMMIVDIAAACVQASPDSRPTTWQVLKLIQEVKEAAGSEDNDSDSASLS